MGGADQRARGGAEIGFITQDGADAGVGQHAPDAVADQQETIAQGEFVVAIVHHQMLIQPQRALEHVLHARLFPDVILAESIKGAVAPAIDPAIADMGEGEAAAAQDHATERGQQRLAVAASLQPAVLRHQQAFQGLGGGPGFRCRVVVERQCLQCRPRSQATVGALADAVGDGEQIALARRQQRCRGDHADGVLVLLARAGAAGFAEAQLQRHGTASGAARSGRRRGRPRIRFAQPSWRPSPRWSASDA